MCIFLTMIERDEKFIEIHLNHAQMKIITYYLYNKILLLTILNIQEKFSI